MELERIHTSDEIRLGDSLVILWNSKLLIATIIAACLVLGGVAYFLAPPAFEAKTSAFPLRQTQFAGYLGLSREEGEKPEDKAFPYTPETLFEEFLSYVKDSDRLAAIASETDVVERGVLNDAAYGQALRLFVSSIKFEAPDAQTIQAGQRLLNIQVRAKERDKLTTFVQTALTSANADMARDLAAEISQRTTEIKDSLDSKAVRLQLDIDARRKRVDNDRTDEMARVGEQSKIADSLGLEKPFGLRAIETAEQGNTAPVQINSGDGQPAYLQGYAALDERIKTLGERRDNDPFINDLRQMQQQLYLTQNDPRPVQILALIKRSPLANPESARVARFGIGSAVAEKVFPRLSVFGAGSLLFGLMLGSSDRTHSPKQILTCFRLKGDKRQLARACRHLRVMKAATS